jgi:hypothetical protein
LVDLTEVTDVEACGEVGETGEATLVSCGDEVRMVAPESPNDLSVFSSSEDPFPLRSWPEEDSSVLTLVDPIES